MHTIIFTIVHIYIYSMSFDLFDLFPFIFLFFFAEHNITNIKITQKKHKIWVIRFDTKIKPTFCFCYFFVVGSNGIGVTNNNHIYIYTGIFKK